MSVSLAELDEVLREQAMRRWRVLRPHVEDGVALSAAAEAAGVPVRTAQRWLARYRAAGLAGLARRARGDRGARRLPTELVEFVEGLALRHPCPSVAFIHRHVLAAAARSARPGPSYSTVYGIVVRGLDPGLVTLAHDGPAHYRDRYELVYRRQAERPNDVWQADLTQLDVLVLDHAGAPARPWLTVILDDHSRAVASYAVTLDPPSALQTALALRQAIWRKSDPVWPVCGIPGVLYSDHGSDFTSRHVDQVCVDLHIQLVHSTAGVPQGRGKIERFFGTITTELLPSLPGHLAPGTGGPVTPPELSLAELDQAIGRFIIGDYHAREHSASDVILTSDPRPASRPRSAGSPVDGCRACPSRSTSSTCRCSRSPSHASCTATEPASRACATSTSRSPPMSASRSPSAMTRATSAKSASFIRACSCAARSRPSSLIARSACATSKPPAPPNAAPCAAS